MKHLNVIIICDICKKKKTTFVKIEEWNCAECGALTGAEWNGHPSDLAIEAEITDTKFLASSSLPDDYVSKVHFSFVNCFNLDLEALLEQLSFEKLILSG